MDLAIKATVGVRIASHLGTMQRRNGNLRRRISLTALTIGVVACLLFGTTSELQAESNPASSSQAMLNLSLVVVPALQALDMAPSLPQSGLVTFSLDKTPREKRYEVRPLPRETHTHNQAPALLETLVIVPE